MPDRLILADTPRAGVVRLALNRPERKNALTPALLELLLEEIARAEATRSMRVLVLTGTGGAFCAGMDLLEGSDVETALAAGRRVRDVLLALATSRMFTVAVVRGPAVAGGAGLVLACDFALASEDAVFGFPEIRRGIVPAMAGALAQWKLGDGAARALLLGGEIVTAAHARASGAFTEVVPAEQLDAAAASLTARLLATGPNAAAGTKAWLARLHHRTIESVLGEAYEFFAQSMAAAEAAEGLAAFREKRDPSWL